MEKQLTRRTFIKRSLTAGAGIAALCSMNGCSASVTGKMKFGLVTYQWGRDWDLPALIENCVKAGYNGVELRTQHAHNVEISLNTMQRLEVKKRFDDSPVKCIGYGSNFEYHSPDQKQLREKKRLKKERNQKCYKDNSESKKKIRIIEIRMMLFGIKK